MAVADIIITPAKVFYAPVGETLPDETDIEYGDVWGGNWTAIAYTNAPLSMMYERTDFEAMIEQSTLPVKRIATEEHFAFETSLAELTAAHMSLILGGSVTTTAAGSAQRGYEEVASGGQFNLSEHAWGFEGLYEDSDANEFPIRVFVYRATAKLNGTLEFSKSAVAGIPLRIDAMGDLDKAAGSQSILFQRVTAEATA